MARLTRSGRGRDGRLGSPAESPITELAPPLPGRGNASPQAVAGQPVSPASMGSSTHETSLAPASAPASLGAEDAAPSPDKYRGYLRSELIEDFRLACMSRSIDDREIVLQKQSRVFLQLSLALHVFL
ncbi:MAG: hypothetical protein ACRD0Z_04260, partial [Acidimicrobiales bacterium]